MYPDQEQYKPHKPYHRSNFQDIFDIVAAKKGLSTTFKAIQVCQEFRSFQKEHLPSQANLKPLYFKNATLTIGAESPAHAQQINQKRHQLQEYLNSKLGAEIVKKIQTKLI